ncbi:hypothetical protein BC939DRAFT_470649 [Gamsiella multidivaricata]|uniref:uncharacterized protein n=1 Tax=Gamsiella multidivaricata TaxID=101098 RepID=UPI00221E4C2A|nr:uncharacterized protein BC939DRAFT_470649 [Gamsiella multidivaricata]KAI7816044.1 hypothetical protein BC939DRAFT_470649 [Gamsiella multidivaricata]
MIYRSKLIWTYGAIEPRFGPMIVALKRLTVQRRLLSGSIYQDQRASMPLGSYALALMLITFLQTENPPILPKLQQAPSQDDHDRPMKEVIVQGIDCSFDRDWKFYRETGSGSGNIKSAAELLVDFCRFFGYVFDYESKEVNARIGAFRWRPDVSNKSENTVDDLASTGSTNVVSMTAPGAMTATTTKEKESSSAVLFQVMDPFVIGLNVMAGCSDEKVRMVKECFQEAYEALIEGDINLAFSDS